ncbi:hypothetical protein AB1Y20_012342 [Prymnesium parvum]|uniref:Uncharacterized protein n=2 Tax=Prymnesium parvum TaxID=97485 RepID=A0AB34IRI5_PRYPA
MGEWLDSQLAVVGELRSFGLDKIEEMTGDRQSAEELLGKVDAQCSEMLKGKLEESCAFADSTLLSEKLKEPLKKSLKELDNLLCGKYPSWKDECGLVRTQANDGSVEWVLPEHVQKFKEMGELLMKAKDD